MFAVLRFCLWVVARSFIAVRYRVRLHGYDKLRGLKPPMLILPNHPALADPAIITTLLWPGLAPRPLAWEGNFRGWIMGSLGKLLNLIIVPDMGTASQQAQAQTQKAIGSVVAALNAGDNVILWPAGRLRRGTLEVIGGARAVSDILLQRPETRVVLARTRGLSGSRFSYAFTGAAPTIAGNLLRVLGLIVANLFFFMPRRQVDITFEPFEPEQLPRREREVLNPWLEQWYNQPGPEAPVYRPYHFLLGARTYEFPKPSAETLQNDKIKPETRAEVAHILNNKLGRTLTERELEPDVHLDQLGLDSMDRTKLQLQIEQTFGFTGGQVPEKVGHLYALAQGLAEKGAIKPPPPAWFKASGQDVPLTIVGATIPEAFLNAALSRRAQVVLADDLAGALTYERLLVGALTMSRHFRDLEGSHVGLLLPASVACDIAFLGLHFAGKLPILLNWTTGPSNLAHAARVMELKHVVTSATFIDRTGIHVEGTEYVFLEKLRASIGSWELLSTLLRVRFLGGTLRRLLPAVLPDAPAVVLFTSGSEKAPKAVPLTHRNLLSNLTGAVEILKPTHADSLLGFLPAFHSFGMTVGCVLPLVSGLRVVHHPDPTDAAGLARKIAAYRPTLLVGTPTFVSYILDRAGPNDLQSLRLIVVGAEKCPENLFGRCKTLAPNAEILEGYGITECAPCVSVNPPGAARQGTIGKALPGVNLAVVDLVTDSLLPVGQQGMLLVSGPNVFPGYIAHDGPPPFQEREGRHWYVTGDLASLDTEGYVHFAGRLKRFLKAGGEMVSLPALEEPFAKKYPPVKEGPRVATEGVELGDGGARIVLFTTEEISLKEANETLWSEGFRGPWRLHEVQRIEQIPVLGTGKTDYKALRTRIADGRR